MSSNDKTITQPSGTNSPPVERKDPLGESGQSKPVADAEQRGEQFNQKEAANIESSQGGSEVSEALDSVKETAEKYNK